MNRNIKDEDHQPLSGNPQHQLALQNIRFARKSGGPPGNKLPCLRNLTEELELSVAAGLFETY